MHHAHIDKFAYGDSPVHRLDARVKFIVAALFTAAVISLPRMSLSIVVCYAVGPFAVLVLAGIPLGFVFKQVLLTCPFVAVLALSFPFYDRAPLTVAFGPWLWHITAGWMRCFVILGKFVVTMLALVALVSTTRFNDLLAGLQRLGLPRILVIQLGFLYRYIFVLIDRVHHILRARSGRRLRSLGFAGELRVAAAMLGSLFIRSIETAERIDIAMQARGFRGRWNTLGRLRVRRADLVFAAAAAVFVLGLYFFIKPVLG